MHAHVCVCVCTAVCGLRSRMDREFIYVRLTHARIQRFRSYVEQSQETNEAKEKQNNRFYFMIFSLLNLDLDCVRLLFVHLHTHTHTHMMLVLFSLLLLLLFLIATIQTHKCVTNVLNRFASIEFCIIFFQCRSHTHTAYAYIHIFGQIYI